MENKDQNNTPPQGETGGLHTPSGAPVYQSSGMSALSLEQTTAETPAANEQVPKVQKARRFLRSAKQLNIVLVVLLVLAMIVGGIFIFRSSKDKNAVLPAASRFDTVALPLSDLLNGKDLALSGASNVTINGQLQVSDSLLLAPMLQPTGAKAGQIYYDKGSNQLAYYNGTNFVFLTGQPSVGIQSLGGATGALTLGSGLALANNQLSNSGVLSVQGQNGDVTFTAGPGIVLNGTNFSNSGVISVAAGTPNVTVGDDGAGNITISVASPLAGTGTVTSGGGTAGKIPVFTASQNIEDSIITQAGLAVTVAGDLTVTGNLNLSTPLSVAQGGTGANTLAGNGVLVGNGAAAISSVAAGGAGLCLLSTAGAPTWGVCPGGGGATVDSLDGLTGALTIANSSGAGSVITIDNASTAAKGIASFNGTNFTVTAGAVNTIQDINSSATPTFAAVVTGAITPLATSLNIGSTSAQLILQGSATTELRATNGANTTTVSFQSPTSNTTYRFLTAPAGTYDICTTQGNCAVSGAVTTGGGTANRLAKFTGAQAINDSTISDDGTTVVTSVDLVVQGGDLTIGVPSAQAGTINLANNGSGFLGSIVQGALSANQTYTLPNASGTICLSSGNCPASGVTSLDGLAGALTIANSSGAGSLITIDDATTTTKGIASFDANNFTVSSGAVSTIQNIGITATPTFAGVITNSVNTSGSSLTIGANNKRLILQGDNTTEIRSYNGANTTTIDFQAPSANTTYRFATSAGGTFDICTSVGNCAGAGGGVTTPGGSINRLTKFSGLQAISNSTITDDGSTVSTSVNMVIQGGGLTVGVPTSQSGVINLARNDTSFVGSIVQGALTGNQTYTLPNASGTICLSSGNCPASGVTSLNSLTGAITIANATTAGSIITIDDATASTKGIASFNNTNFTVTSGAVNTIQNIDTTATPTFAGVNTDAITPVGAALNIGASNKQLILQGSATTELRATNGANTTTVSFQSPTSNTTYRFLTAPAGTYDVCTTQGNCIGSGGAVTTSGGTTNRLAKFTGTQAIDDSSITDNGTNVVTSVDMVIQGGDLTVGVPTSQTGTINLANSGSGFLGSIIQGALSGNRTYTLPDASGTFCLSSGNCPNGGVTSLNGLIGALSIANASAAGSTITIDDATASTKGIASFNNTNFTVSSGAVNTIQNINTGATPTFAGVNTNNITPSSALTLGATSQTALLRGTITTITSNGAGNDIILNSADTIELQGATNVTGNIDVSGTLTSGTGNAFQVAANGDITTSGNAVVSGGSVTIGTTSQAGSFVLSDGSSNTATLQVAPLGQNTSYILPDPGVGSVSICLTSGNCAGTGGGVTTPGGTTNRLAKFSGAGSIADSSISDSAGLVTTTSDLLIQGGDVTVGVANSQAGTINLADGGSAFLGSIIQGALTGNRTYTLPNASGTICLSIGNCSGSGSSSTLQAAYDAGNTIATTDARNIAFTLADTTTDSNFTIDVATGSTGTVAFRRANGSGTADPAQLLLLDNLDTDRAQPTGLRIQSSGGGGITTAIDASSASITNALSTGAAAIVGTTGNITYTNFSITGSNGNITTAGDVAVNGGDITSAGALNITPGGTLTVGVSGQQLILQGNASTQLRATSGGFTTTLGFTGTPTANVTYNLDRTVATGTYTICTDIGNCAGVGGGVTTAGGTTGTYAKFTGAQSIGDSLLSEAGSTATVNGNLNLTSGHQFTINSTQISSGNLSNDADLAKLSASQTFTGNTVAFRNGTDSANAFNVQNTAGNNVLSVDTTGGQVVLGKSSSVAGALVFNNSSNANTVTLTSGTPTAARSIALPDESGTVCLQSSTNCGFAAGSGSTSYIQNQSAVDQAASFRISGTGRAATALQAPLFDTAAAGALSIGTTNATSIALNQNTSVASGKTFTVRGDTLVQPAANSTTAFQVLNTGNDKLLTVETSNNLVRILPTGTITNVTLVSGTGALQIGSDTGDNLAFDDNDIMARTNGAAGTLNLQRLGGTFRVQANSNLFKPLSDSTTAFQIQPSGSTTPVLNADTTNSRIGINIAAPVYPLDVVGDINSSTALRVGGVAVCTVVGCSSSTVDTLQGAYTASVGGSTPEIKLDGTRLGLDIQDSDAGLTSTNNFLSFRGSNPSALGAIRFGVGIQGNVFMQPAADRTDVLDIRTNAGGRLLSVDSINHRVGINLGSTNDPAYSLDVGGDINVGGAGIYRIAGTSGSSTTCTGGNVLQNAVVTGGIITGGTCIANGGGVAPTLQTIYNNSATPAAITLTDGKNLVVNAADTTTDPNILFNLQCMTACSTNGRFAVQNTGTDVFTISPATGATLFQQTALGTAAFNIKNSVGNNVFTIDTTNSRIGFNLGGNTTPALTNAGFELRGALKVRLDDATMSDTFITPAGGSFPAAINVVPYSVGASAQVIAVGLTSGSNVTARGLAVFDARTGSHQPSVAVLSPDENQVGGFSWDGSNTIFLAKSSTANLALQANSLSVLTAQNASGAARVGIGNAAPGYALDVTGDINSTTAYRVAGALGSTTTCSSGNVLQNAVINGGIITGGTCTTNGGTTTLQNVYDNSSSPATILLTNSKNFVINAADTATDSNVIINLQCVTSCSTNGRFAVQNAGTDVFAVAPNGGAATFQNTTNSTTAFRVLTQGAVPTFVVDTTAATPKVYIGNPTSDTTGALLVLDTKSGSGDPTGVNGAMYYNSNAGKFRCFEGSAWANCITSPADMARYIGAGTQVISNNTDTKVEFNNAETTTANVTPSGTNKINFTLNKSGIWTISTSLRYLVGAGASGERYVAIMDSGLSVRYGQSSTFPQGGVAGTVSATTTRRFTAGDVISIDAWQASGTNATMDGFMNGTSLSITFLGD